MQDDQNRTSNQGIGRPRRLANRLREPRTGWILIVMVVATVVFIGLTLWYVANPSWLLRPGTIEVEKPTDRQVVHELVERWRGRWPQIPGPAEKYLSRSRAAVEAERDVEAAEQLRQALSLEPDDGHLLLSLLILDARRQDLDILSDAEAQGVLSAVVETRPEESLLIPATAWMLWAAGTIPEAARSIQSTPPGLEADWLRFELALRDGTEVAAAVEALTRHAGVPNSICRRATAFLGGTEGQGVPDLRGCEESETKQENAGTAVEYP